MNLLNKKILLTVLLFGVAALLVVHFGLFIKLPGTNINTDLREIFVLIGAALTGPIGGGLIGFFSSIIEPQTEIRLYVLIQHVISGTLIGLLYKRYIYEKFAMPYYLAAWIFLVVLYYYLFYWPIMIITFFVFPNLYSSLIAGEQPVLILNAWDFIKGWFPEVIITTSITCAIWIALPPRYRQPLWGKNEKERTPKQNPLTNKFFKSQNIQNTLTLRLALTFFVLAVLPVLIIGVFIKDDVTNTILNREGAVLNELAREFTARNRVVDPRTFYKIMKEIQKTRKGDFFIINLKGEYQLDPVKIQKGKNAYVDFSYDIISDIIKRKDGYKIDVANKVCYGFSHVKMAMHEFIMITVSDKKTLEKTMNELQFVTFYKLGGGILFISFGLIVMLWITVKKPLSILTTAMQRFGNGNMNSRVDEAEMNDEIKILANSFNSMAENITVTNLALQSELKYHKEAEAALTTNEKKYRALFENLTVGFVLYELVYDEKGKVCDFKYVETNHAYEQIAGKSTETFLGKTGRELFTTVNNEYLKKLDAVLTTGVPLAFEYHSNSLNKYIDIWLFRSDKDKVAAIFSDVTEKKHINHLMIQNEKMASIAGLAAGMAHEINNPLGTIVQGCQNIIRRTSNNMPKNLAAAEKIGIDLDKILEYFKDRNIDQIIESIRSAAEKASEIIKNMLQFSRKSESKKVDSDIEKLIEETIELANNDYNLKKKYDFRNIKIEREYEKNIPKLWLTVTEIQQVILNVLQNSAQAMKENDSVKKPEIKIRVTCVPETVRIEIEDNGPGMDEKTCQRVFEPFFTTKEVGEGTGLGLSVSYMIVKNNHYGNIDVESQVGRGTKFIITLPVNAKPL